MIHPLFSFQKTIVNNVEHQRMLDDIEKYGNKIEGEYRGVRYLMRRPGGTYWCGYIYPEHEVDEKTVEELESIAHGGLTSGLGFDCAHYDDYPMFDRDDTRFRDYEYVHRIIKKMIDCVVENNLRE